MSEKLYKELDKYEKTLADYRKRFAPGGISKDEQKILDSVQRKIDGILKQLMATGEIVIVSDPPPPRPSDADGALRYEGIPLDKLKDDRQKNVARANARKVRDGVNSIDAWATRLDAESQKHAEKRQRLNLAASSSENINQAFAKDLKKEGFRKLSKAAGPEFENALAGYEQASSDVKVHLSELKEQAYRIAAAQAMVVQAESLLEAYHKEKDRDAEGKKLAELKEKLEGLKGGVNFVIDFVKDPKGKAKDVVAKLGVKVKDALVDEIVDGLLGGEKLKREMATIETRIAALNKRLEDLKLGGLSAGVNQAFDTVNAEFTKTEQAQEKLAKAKRAQGHAVDQLAGMEKNHKGTTTVFGQLQEYYGNVQDAGAEAMQSSKAYSGELQSASGALAHTAELRKTVLGDRRVMNELYRLGDFQIEDEVHRRQTEAIVAYSKKIDEWHKSQKVDVQAQEEARLQEDLRGNKQFDYIGKLVDAVQEQGLGHKQRDRKTTR